MQLRPAFPLRRASVALAVAAFACGFAAVSTAAAACPCFAEQRQCLADAASPLERRMCKLEFDRCMQRACPAPRAG
ncbi:hypothetical protein SAMN04487939_101775 [Lysobacter sp. yr284]|uniref:hypothetical protein n=1 Tax=Lysobacter TaxID=68 RepID=UPI000899E4CE|nr:hypothetical protein [Lysobacter sp. yr284]SDY31340.1 hypothetical protein SAMN04487939_101775 [Lysobacter sp. yr284]